MKNTCDIWAAWKSGNDGHEEEVEMVGICGKNEGLPVYKSPYILVSN